MLPFLFLLPLAIGAPEISYTVTMADLPHGIIDVAWTLTGQRAQRLCIDMDGAEPALEVPLPRDGACWRVSADAPLPLHLRYRVQLGTLADTHGDPDYASRVGESYIVNDQAFLLRPEPPPAQAAITATFQLPPGVSVTTPWPALPAAGAAPRFRYDLAQLDAGSYVTLGPSRSLGALAIHGGTAALTLLTGAGAPVADDAALRGWVAEALGADADFYGELPGGQVHVILAPVAGSAEPGVFGSILRRGRPSAVLYFGAQAPGAAFRGHWMAVHELFHLGNPQVARRIPWFIEGFTTYYQDVVRARSGMHSATAMWGDLHDGFRRFCDPQEGRSLREESDGLRRLHHYTRLYWGGACLAFRVDVAIRQRSGGKRSLDDVMRELRRRGLAAPLREDQVIAALEREAGAGLVRSHLASREPLFPSVIAPIYRDLGITPTGPESVELRDDARHSALRHQIF